MDLYEVNYILWNEKTISVLSSVSIGAGFDILFLKLSVMLIIILNVHPKIRDCRFSIFFLSILLFCERLSDHSLFTMYERKLTLCNCFRFLIENLTL